MTALHELWARLLSFFQKRKRDREFDEELASHLDLATEEHLRRGASPTEARRLALAEFGSRESAKELHRESRGFAWLDGLIQDLRFALRGLRRAPTFTVTAIVTLATAIGANVAVFSVANAALFKGFSINEGDRIVYISSKGQGGPFVSYPDFVDWRDQAESFEDMGAVAAVRIMVNDKDGDLRGMDATEISVDAFRILGRHPLLGRGFSKSDEALGATSVAIISHALWNRDFGHDANVIGRSLEINGVPTTVIGVMPEDFDFPRVQDLWLPLRPSVRRDSRRLWFVFGRLANAVTMERASAELETIGRRLAADHPNTNENVVPRTHTFDEFFVGANESVRYASAWGAVILLLLIACSNLSNLQMARAASRNREFSIRLALGAGRWRMLRLLLIEGLLLTALGAVLGCCLAVLAVKSYALAAPEPAWLGRGLNYAIDYRGLVYLAVVSSCAALFFGLAPARRLSKNDLFSASRTRRGEESRRLAPTLVAAQIGCSVVLLAGAGVTLRSIWNIQSADIGFRTENILTVYVSLPSAIYPDPQSRASFFARLLNRLDATPGIDAAAAADRFPTWGATRLSYEVDGQLGDSQNRPSSLAMEVSSSYFQTLGVGVLAGRPFLEADESSGLPVAIVNQRFAREQWHGQSPLGKRLRTFGDTTPNEWRTVVGVVSDVVQDDPTGQRVDSMLYMPHQGLSSEGAWIFARTRGVSSASVSAVRHEINELDPSLLMFDFQSLEERLQSTYGGRAISGGLFAAFALIALLLACAGLYALLAGSVSQRTQEIGLRMAVGATQRDIVRLVLNQGLPPLAIGLAVGLLASILVNRAIEAQLVGVSPVDPVTLVAVSAVLILAAAVGCWIPTRRALRVEPVDALRHD